MGSLSGCLEQERISELDPGHGQSTENKLLE
jgi:hypothetical protein